MKSKCRFLAMLVSLLLSTTDATIAQWLNGQSADVVLGQTNFANQFNSLPPSASDIYGPQGIAVDPSTGKVFVADATNNRVLRWSSSSALTNGAAAEAVLGQSDFTSRTAGLSQSALNFPVDIVFDRWGRLYVVDNGNHRVLRFDNASTKTNGANADGVLGQADFGSRFVAVSQNGMNFPRGVAVDTAGRLYVAEGSNHRVLRFDNAATKANGANADGVLGQITFTSNTVARTQSGMFAPQDVIVDNAGRLYVADINNHRVLRFDNAAAKPNGANADGVLGQPNFTTFVAATTQSGMYFPTAIVIDTVSGRLYVSERTNNRVTWFDNAAAKANGAPADGVLGQPDFISNLPGSQPSLPNSPAIDHSYQEVTSTSAFNDQVQVDEIEHAGATYLHSGNLLGKFGIPPSISATANRITAPSYLALDVSGRLYLGDNGNHRVLRFDNAASKVSGANADGVLGQQDLTTVKSIISPSTLFAPGGVAVDRLTGKLFVADGANNRVLRWSSSSAMVSGSAAEAVLGQPNLTSSKPDSTQTGMRSPISLAMDNAGRLWVLEYGNYRILRFDNAATKPNGAPADGVLGQPNFTTRIVPDTNNVTGSSLFAPVNIALDPSGNLYVSDGNAIPAPHRVLRWNSAASKPNGAPPDGVLGQPDFTSFRQNRGRGTTIAADAMAAPFGVATDDAGRLYVGEFVNNRVLRFDNAASKPNGASADAVLAQNDFVSGLANKGGVVGPDGVSAVRSLAVDGFGNLYVSDRNNNRILIFTNAASKSNGASANFVLGQSSFITNTNLGATISSFSGTPSGMALDNVNGKLWIATSFFGASDNRVLRFSASGPLVSVERVNDDQPKSFVLEQNFPNPFNPSTSVAFSLPQTEYVSLKVFNTLGEEVTTLVSQELRLGKYKVEWNASGFASGVYYYRLQAGSFSETKKLMLVR